MTNPANNPIDPDQEIKIIGVYKISPSLISAIEAAKYHQYNWLLDDEGNYVDPIDWENLKDLTLVELQINGPFVTDDLIEIRQDDQSPYMEFYLDTIGKQLITEDQAIQAENHRICFFLHFTNIKKPLLIKDKPYRLPAVGTLPDRLIAFTHYVPAD